MHTSLATVWSNHWPISQHLQDGGLNTWEACPWHGEKSWKPNPAQAKENMISKNIFGRLEKNFLMGKLFPWSCLKTPVFPWFPWLEKNCQIFPWFPDWWEPWRYHILKLAKNLPVCPYLYVYFGRYRFVTLPFRVAPPNNMFQQRMDEIIKHLLNVFSIADDIFTVDYDADGTDHDETLRWEMQIYHQENFMLKKKKMFQVHEVAILW